MSVLPSLAASLHNLNKLCGNLPAFRPPLQLTEKSRRQEIFSKGYRCVALVVEDLNFGVKTWLPHLLAVWP